MSDEKKPIQDEELDKVSGGARTNPVIPVDPIRPGAPPTHPGSPGDPIKPRTNPVG